MRNLIITLILTTIAISPLFAPSACSKESLIEAYLNKSAAVIIGDTGYDLDSTAYIKNIISEYSKRNRCIKIGLDISTDQQELLESLVKGGDSFSALKLSEYINKDAYYDLIESIGKFISEGKCINVYAIDKPETAPVDRDAWMAKQVIGMVGADPVIILSGNLQAIKKIRWINEDNKTIFLAERLRRKGIKTSTLFQYWTSGECQERFNKIILASGPRARSYVADIIGIIGAEMPKNASEITDAIILWNCEGYAGFIADKSARTDIPPDPVDITANIEDPKLKIEDIKVESLKKTIKSEKPGVGMSKDLVLLTRGKPDRAYRIESTGEDEVQQWIYECADDWGFYYECIIVTFSGDKAIKVFDIE